MLRLVKLQDKIFSPSPILSRKRVDCVPTATLLSKIALYEAGADGAILDEVGNTTDVSAVAVRVLVFGR